MKKILTAAVGIAALSLAVSANAAVVSSKVNFSEMSAGNFTETFLVVPDVTNQLILSVTGPLSQFSGLSFSLFDSANLLITKTAFNVANAGNLIAVFNDVAADTVSLTKGATYTLKITGEKALTSLGVASVGTITSRYGTVSPVPEPESYAMLLAGLGLVGGIARRRMKSKKA
jgi:hypothetical protein